MPKRNTGPAWFKLWLHHRPLFDAVSDDVAGKVLKAALCYLADDEIPPLEQLETVVFSAIQADVEEARADYFLKVENGKKGGRNTKDDHEKPVAGIPNQHLPVAGIPNQHLPVAGIPNQHLPVAGIPNQYLPVAGIPDQHLPLVREGEEEGEREGEREGEGEVIIAAEPPARPVFSPPSLEEVKQYCREQGYRINAEHFMDHYESNGWMVGKNHMKNWKAAVRGWNRKEKTYNNGKTGAEQIWDGIGTVL